ncbi:hypothetical protein [Melghirimyces profundicolus]|nr:hypothetical protein [Melghirimyces profundicolus]
MIFMDFYIQLASGRVDVIPDVAGWGLIIYGLGLLAGSHPPFRRVRVLAIVLLASSFIDFLQNIFSPVSPPMFLFPPLSDQNRMTLIIQTTVYLLNVVFIHTLCRGISDWAQNRDLGDSGRLGKGTITSGRWFLWLSGILFILLPFSLLGGNWIPPTFTVLLLTASILYLTVVALVWRAGTLSREAENKSC